MGKTRIENHIRRLRFEHNEMTQQDLAERVNVTRQTINAIELVFGKPLEAVFSWPEPAENAEGEQGNR